MLLTFLGLLPWAGRWASKAAGNRIATHFFASCWPHASVTPHATQPGSTWLPGSTWFLPLLSHSHQLGVSALRDTM